MDGEEADRIANDQNGSTSPETESRGSSDSKKRKLTATSPTGVPVPSNDQNAQLPPWVAGGSPARFVAPDELLKMSVAMDNLTLVHEIAIDPEFSVSEVPSNPVEAAIKENMHRAYWDLLTEDLAKSPPDHSHAFNLLMEIKQTILDDLLSTAHVRLRAEVLSVLDEDTLRNKLEQNCLDIHGIGRFVVDLLGRLCAPERDPLIEKLRREEGVVELIKGIFSLMDIMKNDLTNYVISSNRAAVEEYSAKFEYKEFLKYLEKFPEQIKEATNADTYLVMSDLYIAFEDGSLRTKEWINHAYHEVYPSTSTIDSQPEPKREKRVPEEVTDEEVVRATSRGYLKLVESRNPEPFPETLRIDKMRLAALSEKYLQMNIVTSAVFITCKIAGKQVSEHNDFKKSLKDQLIVITNDIEQANAVKTLEGVCEQCVVSVFKSANELGTVISKDQEEAIRQQIHALSNENNAIRTLVCARMAAFVEEILCSPTEVPNRLSPGLSIIQSELCAFTASDDPRMSYPRHPNAVVITPPTQTISPLIRFGRYTALGLGILWGAFRLRQIREYHADIREWEHEKALAKAAEEAKKKKWLAKDEMRYLMKVINLPFEEGVTQFGVADLYREE